MMLFLGWNVSVSQAINPLPYIVQAQRLFAQRDLLRRRDAVGDGVPGHPRLAVVLPQRLRLVRGLSGRAHAPRRSDWTPTSRARVLPQLTARVTRRTTALRLEDVDVRTPDGQPLIQRLNVRLDPGDSLVDQGTVGKRQDGAPGEPRRPVAVRLGQRSSSRSHAAETMFLSQLPYLPLGDLRAVASYPRPDGRRQRRRRFSSALLKVALPHLIIRIREVRDWGKMLSVGEQQRIAFARILLNEPKAVFLDESTSALDEGLELMLYRPFACGAARLDRGQRQPPGHRRAAPRTAARTARRRRMAARSASPATTVSHRRRVRGTLPGWTE